MAISSADSPRDNKPREHRVTIIINAREVFDWVEYQIDSSVVEPSDSFSLRRAFDTDAWNTCMRDAPLKVLIDGICIIDGFLEQREKRHAEGLMEIGGRDKVGRLVDESALRTKYDGLTLIDTVKQVCAPWFQTVVLTNARNRSVRRGKGYKAAAGAEPVFIPPRPKNGRIEPGQQKWTIIEKMVSQAGLIAWSSADGRELFVGRPNHNQAPQYLVRMTAAGSPNEPIGLDLVYTESNANRFAKIIAVGAGAASDSDYGKNMCTRSNFVVDNEDNKTNGTGRDFLAQKTLITTENALRSNDEASRVASREKARRDFNRTKATATMPYHGQIYRGQTRTLYAPDTIIRVIDEEIDLDDGFYIYACSYTSTRDQGEQTRLDMVPQGTEIVL